MLAAAAPPVMSFTSYISFLGEGYYGFTNEESEAQKGWECCKPHNVVTNQW